MVKANKCICKKIGEKTCSKCEIKKYCSTECQKSDWSKHKKVCVFPQDKNVDLLYDYVLNHAKNNWSALVDAMVNKELCLPFDFEDKDWHHAEFEIKPSNDNVYNEYVKKAKDKGISLRWTVSIVTHVNCGKTLFLFFDDHSEGCNSRHKWMGGYTLSEDKILFKDPNIDNMPYTTCKIPKGDNGHLNLSWEVGCLVLPSNFR